jgi:hypothetical protein
MASVLRMLQGMRHTHTRGSPAGTLIRGLAVLIIVSAAIPRARAQFTVPTNEEKPWADEEAKPETWLDRTHFRLHQLVASTARRIDQLAGPSQDKSAYQDASGSIALAMLWDEFNGLKPRARFRVDLPLPQINRRLHLFVGRVNREEYVTERALPSGAFPRYRTDMDEEQTLAGIVFLPSSGLGGHFDGGVGARLRSSELDPYVKVGYRYRRLFDDDLRLTLNETLFYQKSEGLGVTSRLDLERIIADNWHARWTGSATIAERSAGVRGYTTLTLTRGLPDRRAVIFQLGLEGESDAPVPIQDYGLKVAYRRSVSRDWLVMEVRTSLTWPKEERGAPRKPSWGLGIGCEVYFGTDEFSVRPVTL